MPIWNGYLNEMSQQLYAGGGRLWQGDDRIWGSHEVLFDISIVKVFSESL